MHQKNRRYKPGRPKQHTFFDRAAVLAPGEITACRPHGRYRLLVGRGAAERYARRHEKSAAIAAPEGMGSSGPVLIGKVVAGEQKQIILVQPLGILQKIVADALGLGLGGGKDGDGE